MSKSTQLVTVSIDTGTATTFHPDRLVGWKTYMLDEVYWLEIYLEGGHIVNVGFHDHVVINSAIDMFRGILEARR